MLPLLSCREMLPTFACTQIGCDNGLAVSVANNPPGPWEIDVAATGQTTRTFTCPAGANCQVAFFANFLPNTVTVTVRAGGLTQTHQNLTPTPRVVRPNGNQCEPACNQPVVTVPLP